MRPYTKMSFWLLLASLGVTIWMHSEEIYFLSYLMIVPTCLAGISFIIGLIKKR